MTVRAGSRCVKAIILLAAWWAVAAAPAAAAVHARFTAAASSTLASPVTNVVDGNSDTGWSSNLCPNARSCPEWLAFWLDDNQTVDYLRLVPRLHLGVPQSVPETVNIYYVGPDTLGNWSYLTTVALEGGVRAGNVVYLPFPVTALTSGGNGGRCCRPAPRTGGWTSACSSRAPPPWRRSAR